MRPWAAGGAGGLLGFAAGLTAGLGAGFSGQPCTPAPPPAGAGPQCCSCPDPAAAAAATAPPPTPHCGRTRPRCRGCDVGDGPDGPAGTMLSAAAARAQPTKFRSDDATASFGHHEYAGLYQQLLGPRQNATLRLLEIGLGCEPGVAGRSLEMWRRFFSNGEVYAADYSPLRARCLNWWREVVTRGGFADDARGRAFYEGQWNGSGRPRVLWLDQGDRDSLGRVAGRVGDLDVVIDDGSHRALHMINTFEVFFPKLRPGGVYIVEDLEANFITNPKEETGLSNASGGRRLFGARAEAAAEQRRDEIRSRRTMVDYLANLTLDLSFPYYRGTDVGQHPEHVQNSHALWVGSVECARYICAVRKRHHPFRPPRWFVSNPSRWGDMPMHMWPKYVLRSMRPGWNKGKRGIPRQVKELYRIKISSLYPCPRDCRTGVCSCTFSFLRPANVSDRGEAAAEGSAEDAR
eukprot:TRINITY_DN24547_c0_g1_i1.p1 TRINITY_DN24547_c0_g1~~TRINITY_DN24547_c0_g1_i1.p1  ORF type:complete len:494 (+),score=117.58 TRINITY_DN24547_c0_g1_i1:98-1483(+)